MFYYTTTARQSETKQPVQKQRNKAYRCARHISRRKLCAPLPVELGVVDVWVADPGDKKMSVWAPDTMKETQHSISRNVSKKKKEDKPFENPSFELYTGDLGFPDKSDPLTSMLFRSNWFQKIICLAPFVQLDWLPSHHVGGMGGATAAFPGVPVTLHLYGNMYMLGSPHLIAGIRNDIGKRRELRLPVRYLDSDRGNYQYSVLEQD